MQTHSMQVVQNIQNRIILHTQFRAIHVKV